MARKGKTAPTKPEAETEGDDVFLSCNQCHNTGGCARGGKCEKGFK